MLSLRETVAEMRELGVTRYRTADYEIELGAPPQSIELGQPVGEQVATLLQDQQAARAAMRAQLEMAYASSGASFTDEDVDAMVGI